MEHLTRNRLQTAEDSSGKGKETQVAGNKRVRPDIPENEPHFKVRKFEAEPRPASLTANLFSGEPEPGLAEESLHYSSTKLELKDVIAQDRLGDPTGLTYTATYREDKGVPPYRGYAHLVKSDTNDFAMQLELSTNDLPRDGTFRPMTPRLKNRAANIYLQRKTIDQSALNERDEIERDYRHLFDHPGITKIPASENKRFSNVVDSLRTCIVVPKGTKGAIGTKGLATCFAISMRAKNSAGDTILGQDHYDPARQEEQGYRSPREAVRELIADMIKTGAHPDSIEIYFTGGQLAPSGTASNTLELEKDFLSLSKEEEFKSRIVAAKTHATAVECNKRKEKIERFTDDDHNASISTVITEEGVYYSHGPLYDDDAGKNDPDPSRAHAVSGGSDSENIGTGWHEATLQKATQTVKSVFGEADENDVSAFLRLCMEQPWTTEASFNSAMSCLHQLTGWRVSSLRVPGTRPENLPVPLKDWRQMLVGAMLLTQIQDGKLVSAKEWSEAMDIDKGTVKSIREAGRQLYRLKLSQAQ